MTYDYARKSETVMAAVGSSRTDEVLALMAKSPGLYRISQRSAQGSQQESWSRDVEKASRELSPPHLLFLQATSSDLSDGLRALRSLNCDTPFRRIFYRYSHLRRRLDL